MKRLVVVCLILLMLAISTQALSAIQLSGDNGKAILQKIVVNSTSNGTAQANNSTSDLWSWGPLPVGHLLNSSGMLNDAPNEVVIFQI